jgi:hypothetical protein
MGGKGSRLSKSKITLDEKWEQEENGEIWKYDSLRKELSINYYDMSDFPRSDDNLKSLTEIVEIEKLNLSYNKVSTRITIF